MQSRMRSAPVCPKLHQARFGSARSADVLRYTFRPRRRPKRLRDKREEYHHSLKALAIREKKIHIVGSPELKIEGTPFYLDVEGLPDRDFCFLIGHRIHPCCGANRHQAGRAAGEGNEPGRPRATG
ncbi:MAG: hypothetical protein HZA90_15170 [Verrucomicrobia bacterium]|nr:hypothetical protein [Verrucomicrobiota bacterium]